jgi:Cu(I)/Ag(I) efflux system membrane fusion protein
MKLRTPLLVICLLGALVVLGYAFWSVSIGKPGEAGRKVVYYQDSMHPWIKSEAPGKCTICLMDLTPIFQGEKGFGDSETVVTLNSNSITVLNVQTDEVKRQPLRRTLRVAGTLEADETRTTVFSAPAAGRIEHLAVEYAGIEVKEGQPLLTFYSPELVALRRQYVVRGRPTIALRQSELSQGHADSATSSELSQPRSRTPGRAGGMMLVTETDPYYADLISPQTGTVTERKVFAGQYVAEGDRLFTIVDTSVMWLRFDAYEQQLSWLRPGQKLTVTLPALPGREFPATIAWIEPTLDQTTRSAKVRADLTNPLDPATEQRLLRLGMYAEAQVSAEVPDVLSVRRSAVLLPGAQAYAYVEKGPGAYEMRRLRLGRQGDDSWEVLAGLDEGDRVVAAGNVLIDAQAQFTLGIDPAHDASAKAGSNAEEGTHAMASSGSSLPPAGQKGLEAFLAVADAISAALASDNIESLKAQTDKLPGSVSAALDAFPDGDSWHELLERIQKHSTWPAFGDLASARKSFLPFSTETVELVQQLRSQVDTFARAKVYHCPMAPKPGLWFQAKGPLRNPFYGAKMLSCGEEVRSSARVPAVASSPVKSVPEVASHPKASPGEAVAQVTGVSNRRSPEPMMRMAQALSLRLAEDKRTAGSGDHLAAAAVPAVYTVDKQERAEASAAQKMSLAVSSRASAAGRDPENSVHDAKPAPQPLTESQQKACDAFVNVAAAISEGLAADDLKAFNKSIGAIGSATSALLREFPHPHPWNSYARQLAAFGRWSAAANLDEARQRFLGFSTNTVAFAKTLKESGTKSNLKIYHCPMAPKPGLWLQKAEPLRNPFFGAEMLSCGKEILQ